MKQLKKLLAAIALSCMFTCFASPSNADFTIEFDNTDFTMTPQFNRLRDFAFSIDIAEDLVAGGVYSNPDLNVIVYRVFGILDTEPTPSGFPAFNLQRTIIGDEFYTQGSSLNFEISTGADLSDGLQASELVADGIGKVFEFNGREVGTGRYHPALLELFSDGTGRIQNSNNMGGINPGNNMEVDVTFGEEYIVDLDNSTSLLLAVPEPSSVCLISFLGLAGLVRRRR